METNTDFRLEACTAEDYSCYGGLSGNGVGAFIGYVEDVVLLVDGCVVCAVLQVPGSDGELNPYESQQTFGSEETAKDYAQFVARRLAGVYAQEMTPPRTYRALVKEMRALLPVEVL